MRLLQERRQSIREQIIKKDFYRKECQLFNNSNGLVFIFNLGSSLIVPFSFRGQVHTAKLSMSLVSFLNKGLLLLFNNKEISQLRNDQ